MSKATKVISDVEKQKEMQLKAQIKMIPTFGTKYIIAQFQEGAPAEYLEACKVELERRGVTEMPQAVVLSAAHAPVEPTVEAKVEAEGEQAPPADPVV